MITRYILASRSPKRAELLAETGLKFDVCPADIDEVFLAGQEIGQNLTRIAAEKAQFVRNHSKEQNLIIIAADTVVECGGKIIGKPSEKGDAELLLRELSGKRMRVLTGYCILRKDIDRVMSGVAVSELFFRKLSDKYIREYVESGAGMGKAGGYGMESGDDENITLISGTAENVMGFPLEEIMNALAIIQA